jgi:hypothetical protein
MNGFVIKSNSHVVNTAVFIHFSSAQNKEVMTTFIPKPAEMLGFS